MSFADDLRRRIEAEHARRGGDLHWRLLYSPPHVLDGADIAFIGLNPGGRSANPDHPDLAPSRESSYVAESWAGAPAGESRFQVQVRELFATLGVRPTDVLAGNLIPFRSPDWKSLEDKPGTIAFGGRLWLEILDRASPRLIVTTGAQAFEAVRRLIGAELDKAYPVGWGKVKGKRARAGSTIIVGLPHLSRYPVVTRDVSQPALDLLFGADWKRSRG